MEPQFGAEQVAALREEFEQHSACPREEDKYGNHFLNILI